MLYFQGFLKLVHLPMPCSFGFWKTHTWVDPKTKRSLCWSSTFVLTNSETEILFVNLINIFYPIFTKFYIIIVIFTFTATDVRMYDVRST